MKNCRNANTSNATNSLTHLL